MYAKTIAVVVILKKYAAPSLLYMNDKKSILLYWCIISESE